MPASAAIFFHCSMSARMHSRKSSGVLDRGCTICLDSVSHLRVGDHGARFLVHPRDDLGRCARRHYQGRSAPALFSTTTDWPRNSLQTTSE
jgi:hypothetical protein